MGGVFGTWFCIRGVGPMSIIVRRLKPEDWSDNDTECGWFGGADSIDDASTNARAPDGAIQASVRNLSGRGGAVWRMLEGST
jgi:hypothetical protein